MSFNLEIRTEIHSATVILTGVVAGPAEARTVIADLLGMDRPQATTASVDKATTTGKSTKAAQTPKAEPAASSPVEQTQTASNSSADSSTDTAQAGTAPADDAGKATGESTVAYEYDKHVKPLVLAISKKSREWAMALLQRHGAIDKDTGNPSAKALTPDQYPQFVSDAQAVLDGKLDPTASDTGDIA